MRPSTASPPPAPRSRPPCERRRSARKPGVGRWVCHLDSRDGVPPHQRAAALRLDDHQQPQDRGPSSRRGHHGLRLRQPRHPLARYRRREAGRSRPQPPQPSVLVEQGHPQAARGRRRSLRPELERRARRGDRDHHDHRGQRRLVAPHVGLARTRRQRVRAEPQLPDPHLRTAVRRRRGAAGQDRSGRRLLWQPGRGVGDAVAEAPGADPVVPAQPDNGMCRPSLDAAPGRLGPRARGGARPRLRLLRYCL